MDEFKRVLIQGIGLGLAVVGVGGFVIGAYTPAPWLLIGLSASIFAISILYKGDN